MNDAEYDASLFFVAMAVLRWDFFDVILKISLPYELDL